MANAPETKPQTHLYHCRRCSQIDRPSDGRGSKHLVGITKRYTNRYFTLLYYYHRLLTGSTSECIIKPFGPSSFQVTTCLAALVIWE